MPYLGKTPSQATRQRYYLTASGGETSISGTMTTGGTLTFNDGEFVDVKLNGVSLVAGTDYNTSTANTIAGLSALAANDQVEIVVYDTFSVFSGDVDSNLSVGGNLSVTGTTALTGNATASGTASIAGHASIGVDAVNSARALTVAGATDGSSSTILQLYNSSLASKFSVRDDGFVDVAGNMQITTDGNDSQLTLKSTDADSSTGPVLDLVRDSASPADGDAIGKIAYIADNDAGEATTYSSAFTTLRDASDGAEDGQVINYVITNGSLVDHLRMGRGSAGGQSEVVINEGSVDMDFRVESDGSANMLFVDGSASTIFVNENSTNLPCKMHIKFNGSSEQGLVLDNSVNNSSGAAIRFVDHTDAHTGGGVYFSDSNNINYATSSDARLKDNITDMTGSIDRVKALAPKRFNFTSNPDITMDGFLAHEAQAVVPEAVNGTENAVDDNDNPIYQAMDAGRLVPLLTGALKEAIAKIETLETKVAALEAGE